MKSLSITLTIVSSDDLLGYAFRFVSAIVASYLASSATFDGIVCLINVFKLLSY